jgi:hypothetical protein
MAVCEFLQKLICPANCVYLNRLAEAYVCPALLESSRRFIQRNFEDVCRTEDFLELGVGEVEELISMDNIFVTSEETVVEAVLAWCKRNGPGHINGFLSYRKWYPPYANHGKTLLTWNASLIEKLKGLFISYFIITEHGNNKKILLSYYALQILRDSLTRFAHLFFWYHSIDLNFLHLMEQFFCFLNFIFVSNFSIFASQRSELTLHQSGAPGLNGKIFSIGFT